MKKCIIPVSFVVVLIVDLLLVFLVFFNNKGDQTTEHHLIVHTRDTLIVELEYWVTYNVDHSDPQFKNNPSAVRSLLWGLADNYYREIAEDMSLDEIGENMRSISKKVTHNLQDRVPADDVIVNRSDLGSLLLIK